MRGTRSRQPIEEERRTTNQGARLLRCACTRSRVYGGIKEGAVALVRSLAAARRPVANQRGVATVHRPTADYRFSASRYRTAGEVHQVGPHPPFAARRRPAMLTTAAGGTRTITQGRFLRRRNFLSRGLAPRTASEKNGSLAMDSSLIR